MISNIEMAQNALKQSEVVYPEHRAWWQRQAQVYSNLAQAEQLKRIADSLDVIIQGWAKPQYVVNNPDK